MLSTKVRSVWCRSIPPVTCLVSVAWLGLRETRICCGYGIHHPEADCLSYVLVHLTRHSCWKASHSTSVHRIAEQQEMIANLLMVDSEHRLGNTPAIGQELGHPDPQSTRIEQKITHEELSEMVGTTKTSNPHFLRKFRAWV